MRKLTIAVTAVFALAGFAASGAQACSYSGAEQVFSRWGDQHSYVLGPDGGFEYGGLGWLQTGGAAVVADNESFFLNGPGNSGALSLPAGSSAISPPVCMAIDTPIFRLLGRNSGDPSSGLRVEAIYPLLGLLRTKTVSTVYAGSDWAPSQQMLTVLTLSTVLGTLVPSSVQIRITPVGSGGNWTIDDLYIDPFARR